MGPGLVDVVFPRAAIKKRTSYEVVLLWQCGRCVKNNSAFVFTSREHSLAVLIAGTIPGELCKLNRLQTVNLSNNRLEGEWSLERVCAAGSPIWSILSWGCGVFD